MESVTKDGATAKELDNMDSRENSSNPSTIVYVLGGPGSGKSTQCSKIASSLGFCHLSAGDLLQAEVESGSDDGKMIQEYKNEGKLVPAEMVAKLLRKAMRESENKRFLIDGFPRSKENVAAAEHILKIEPDFVLFLDCSEGVMTRRLLNRNQGRADDNLETIKKRLEVYFESTLPVVDYYSSKGKIRKVDAERTGEEVFDAIKGVFSELNAGREESTKPSSNQSS